LAAAWIRPATETRERLAQSAALGPQSDGLDGQTVQLGDGVLIAESGSGMSGACLAFVLWP
jgi:hypothetical protein